MSGLRRHRLAYLGSDGWRTLLEADWEPSGRQCLQHWQQHGLPLVVTRQPVPAGAGEPQQLALGLPVPHCWGRRNVALQVDWRHVQDWGEFPLLQPAAGMLAAGRLVSGSLASDTSDVLKAVDDSLQRAGIQARVYGSVGWQALTGLHYIHSLSDLDLLLPASDAGQADRIAAELQQFRKPLRLDGELCFADGSAIAWREWLAWRQGRCTDVLVKRLHGATLERQLAGMEVMQCQFS